MKYNELEQKVIEWGKEKGILEKATPLTQIQKTEEEFNELKEAITAQRNGLDFYYNLKGKRVNTKEEIIDGLGDVIVTLILQSKMQNISLLDCLESAYNVISKRTGKMINGQFVKDGN